MPLTHPPPSTKVISRSCNGSGHAFRCIADHPGHCISGDHRGVPTRLIRLRPVSAIPRSSIHTPEHGVNR